MGLDALDPLSDLLKRLTARRRTTVALGDPTLDLAGLHDPSAVAATAPATFEPVGSAPAIGPTRPGPVPSPRPGPTRPAAGSGRLLGLTAADWLAVLGTALAPLRIGTPEQIRQGSGFRPFLPLAAYAGLRAETARADRLAHLASGLPADNPVRAILADPTLAREVSIADVVHLFDTYQQGRLEGEVAQATPGLLATVPAGAAEVLPAGPEMAAVTTPTAARGPTREEYFRRLAALGALSPKARTALTSAGVGLPAVAEGADRVTAIRALAGRYVREQGLPRVEAVARATAAVDAGERAPADLKPDMGLTGRDRLTAIATGAIHDPRLSDTQAQRVLAAEEAHDVRVAGAKTGAEAAARAAAPKALTAAEQARESASLRRLLVGFRAVEGLARRHLTATTGPAAAVQSIRLHAEALAGGEVKAFADFLTAEGPIITRTLEDVRGNLARSIAMSGSGLLPSFRDQRVTGLQKLAVLEAMRDLRAEDFDRLRTGRPLLEDAAYDARFVARVDAHARRLGVERPAWALAGLGLDAPGEAPSAGPSTPEPVLSGAEYLRARRARQGR